uniref:Ig-like domain-containing protein n=1 Tax=Cyprinus carpio TaxID=7962 RepID=A0A8C1ZIN1_CYPCA
LGCFCMKTLFYYNVSLFSVSLRVTVEGVIGGFVVLPCSSKKTQLTVNWRYGDRLIVYAIIKGKVSVEGQDPKYKNRAESFPEEYLRGNFSLKLSDLQHTDAGKYQCYIIEESDIQTVELRIKVGTEKQISETEFVWSHDGLLLQQSPLFFLFVFVMHIFIKVSAFAVFFD